MDDRAACPHSRLRRSGVFRPDRGAGRVHFGPLASRPQRRPRIPGACPSPVRFGDWPLPRSRLAYLQLVLGSVLRHMPVGAEAARFAPRSVSCSGRRALMIHVMLLVARVPQCPRRRATSCGRSLARWSALLSQMVLGVGTWVVKYGWPVWFGRFGVWPSRSCAGRKPLAGLDHHAARCDRIADFGHALVVIALRSLGCVRPAHAAGPSVRLPDLGSWPSMSTTTLGRDVERLRAGIPRGRAGATIVELTKPQDRRAGAGHGRRRRLRGRLGSARSAAAA